jgi:DNA-binding CsgD family transcriptional regulator
MALAEQTRELPRIARIRIARGEAAWLAGDLECARRELATALPSVLRQRSAAAGELLFALSLCGEAHEVPRWISSAFSLHLRRRFAAAADAWSTLGCPYERAWALAGAGADTGLREAFEILERLGMHAAAARAVERLRSIGARSIPRGPRATTRANAAGLTAREVEVLQLIAQGLKNAEIACRLFISSKTVGHHVSAILGKIAVDDRREAALWFREHGAQA